MKVIENILTLDGEIFSYLWSEYLDIVRVETELHLTAQPQLHSVDGVDCLQLRSNIRDRGYQDITGRNSYQY